MARSVYFSQGTRSEQLFHEDIIVEAIKIYGQTFYYIPRTLVGKDEILGEDRLSQFKSAYPIEMYLENATGFDGQGAFIQKFGLMMEQSATLTVARRTWEQFVGQPGRTILPNRPAEGDLLYFPLTGGLFEIKFVTHQDPFYQIGKLFVYKLQVELFQYASEKMQTGIKEIDAFESLKSFDEDVVPNGIVKNIKITNIGIGYATAPTVTIGEDWVAETAVTLRQVVCFAGNRYIVTKAGTTGSTGPTHTSGIVSNGSAEMQYTGTRATATAYLGSGLSVGTVVKILVTDAGSGYTNAPSVTLSGGGGNSAAAIAVIGNLDNQDSFGDNNKFKEEAVGIVFSEDNPFGEIVPYPSPVPNYVATADNSSLRADSSTLTADTM